MFLQEDFDKAAEEAKTLPKDTSNDDKLALYGLFKQGTVGDNNTCASAYQPYRQRRLMTLPSKTGSAIYSLRFPSQISVCDHSQPKYYYRGEMALCLQPGLE